MSERHIGSTAGRSTAESEPLLLHSRGGIVVVALLLITLGLMFGPLILHLVNVPLR